MLTLKEHFHNVMIGTEFESPSFSQEATRSMLNLNQYNSSFQIKTPKTGKLFYPILRFSLLLSVIGLLGGCRSGASTTPQASAIASSPSPSPSAPTPKATPRPKSVKSTKSGKTVLLNVYQLDDQCNRFKAEKVTFPASQAVDRAVSKVLQNVESGDLDLAGYRVKVASGIATVDLRLGGTSRRSLAALSNCEQLALYGSLRKTLTGNAPLKIKSVEFTERGKKITPQ